MKTIFHNLRRPNVCKYQVAEDVACGVTFEGPPNQDYCDTHRAMHREKMLPVWRKRAGVHAGLGIAAKRRAG